MKPSDQKCLAETKHKLLIIPPTTAAQLSGPEAERDAVTWNVVQAVAGKLITAQQGADALTGLAMDDRRSRYAA